MIMPASLLSLIDWWASLGMGGFGGYVNWRVTELDEVDWFQNSPGAEGATRRALEHFKRALNNSAELLCQNKCPIISSFYTGSGEVSFQDLLAEARGKPVTGWNIPQNEFWSRLVLGGAEFRLTKLDARRASKVRVAWEAEITIVDKLGWEAAAYGPNLLAEILTGPSREFVRGRLTLNGSVLCCEEALP